MNFLFGIWPGRLEVVASVDDVASVEGVMASVDGADVSVDTVALVEGVTSAEAVVPLAVPHHAAASPGIDDSGPAHSDQPSLTCPLRPAHSDQPTQVPFYPHPSTLGVKWLNALFFPELK